MKGGDRQRNALEDTEVDLSLAKETVQGEEIGGSLQAVVRVGYRAGTQSRGRIIGYVAGCEGVEVAGEEWLNLVMLDDFKQMNPTERLLGERPDAIAISGFLRPAEAGQHQLKFRGVDGISRFHWHFPLA